MRQIIRAFYRSVIKAKKSNAFEYFFHSTVEKDKLSEFHSFSFLMYLALRSQEYCLLVHVLREVLVYLQLTGGIVLAIGSTGDGTDLGPCLDMMIALGTFCLPVMSF